MRVALTFDAEHGDRPATAGNDARLLDALAADGVAATFFVQGRWAEAFPELAARIGRSGHLVGSHGHHHVRMSMLSEVGLAAELEAAAEALRATTGADGRPWFRCPFGDGVDEPRVAAAITAAGYRHAGWHVDTQDWNPANSAGDVVDGIVAGVERVGDGAVVLLHTWPDATVGAVPEVVARLRATGAELVRLDALPNPPFGVPGDA